MCEHTGSYSIVYGFTGGVHNVHNSDKQLSMQHIFMPKQTVLSRIIKTVTVMDPTALLCVVQIAASHGTFRVILHFGIFCMSISNYECTIACDRCRAHPGNDSTLKRYAEIPLASLKERELLVSSLTAAARKPSICPLSKDSIVPSSLRRESELKRSSPVGQRLRRWALGRCLKPHGGEEARHRASLCGSWTTVGALPQFNCTV